MSTPESEYEFNGIIMVSYTAGELNDVQQWGAKSFERLEMKEKRKRIRGIGLRRGHFMDPFPDDWKNPGGSF